MSYAGHTPLRRPDLRLWKPATCRYDLASDLVAMSFPLAEFMDPAPSEDPAAEAISRLLPVIRSTKRNGWLQAAAGTIGLLALAAALISWGGKAVDWALLAAVMAFAVPFWVATEVRKKHERALLPVISESFGLIHRKSPAGFFESLPEVFLPKGGVRTADDQMSGRLADRRFTFTEVKVATGGKRSRTLFRGVVTETETGRLLPPFVIASTSETKGFLFLKANVHVAGMDWHHGVTAPDGTFYGLWSRPDTGVDGMAGMSAFLDRMVAIGPEVLGDSRLYSVACTGTSILVALGHSRDFFRIGGLLADEQTIMSDIRAAASEFSQPVRLVTEILRAEAALTAASAG